MTALAEARKAIAALLTGVAAWGVVASPDGITTTEWWSLAGVVTGAIVVWLVPNQPVEDV